MSDISQNQKHIKTTSFLRKKPSRSSKNYNCKHIKNTTFLRKESSRSLQSKAPWELQQN